MCGKNVHYGRNKTDVPTFCHDCKEEDMYEFYRRKCLYINCAKKTLPGKKNNRYCADHLYFF